MDEASLVSNKDFQWLLDFTKANGCRLDLNRAQHVRQGHTVTSQVSQLKEREKMFCLGLTSALPLVNAAQALVDVSRTIGEARVYTDSVESFEVKVGADSGHRQAAIDFLEGHEAKASRSREQGIEVGLQEGITLMSVDDF